MEKRKPTVATFRKMKKAGEKIVVLTAYDAPGAALADVIGVIDAQSGQRDLSGVEKATYDETRRL